MPEYFVTVMINSASDLYCPVTFHVKLADVIWCRRRQKTSVERANSSSFVWLSVSNSVRVRTTRLGGGAVAGEPLHRHHLNPTGKVRLPVLEPTGPVPSITGRRSRSQIPDHVEDEFPGQ